MDYEGRIAKARGALEAHDVDAFLVTDLTNVAYLTGFTGSNGFVLITADSALFISDERYRARAGDLVGAADIEIYRDRVTEVLRPRLEGASVGSLGVEAGTVTLQTKADLEERLPSVRIEGLADAVEKLRRTKEPAEVDAIREAVRLGDEAFAWVVDNLRPGVTEREIALDLEVWMRKAGAQDVSFDPIVGSGPLSAHIHHTASDRTMEKGDLVLLDFGCRVDGYCSDMTRTVSLGPAPDEAPALYELVLRAQNAGIEAVRSDVPGAEVDRAARAIIEEAGRGEQFGHGLGHGVGLDIHEAPRLGRISEDVLAPGDVVTVEPGVYVPGSGGIRIEDIALVTDVGFEILGSAPKDRLLEV